MRRDSCWRIRLAPLLPARRPAPISQPIRRSTTCWATVSGEGATVSGTKSNGTMRYNSLQAVVQKADESRFAVSGLVYVLQVHVRQHRLLRRVEQRSECLSILAERLRPESEYAPCYYDATHVLSAYAIYDLPFGRGKMVGKNVNGVVNQVIGGWAVSPIVSFRTGWPLPVYGAQDNSGTFGRGARADCNGVPSITKTTIPGIGRSVVQQYWTIHQSSGWHLWQLLAATRWAAFAPLHRRRHEFA